MFSDFVCGSVRGFTLWRERRTLGSKAIFLLCERVQKSNDSAPSMDFVFVVIYQGPKNVQAVCKNLRCGMVPALNSGSQVEHDP